MRSYTVPHVPKFPLDADVVAGVYCEYVAITGRDVGVKVPETLKRIVRQFELQSFMQVHVLASATGMRLSWCRDLLDELVSQGQLTRRSVYYHKSCSAFYGESVIMFIQEDASISISFPYTGPSCGEEIEGWGGVLRDSAYSSP